MMNNSEKEAAFERLDDLAQELDLWIRCQKSCNRWGVWIKFSLFLIIAQGGAIIYDMTLPVYQSLWLPFFACWLLSWVGETIPKREMNACFRARDVIHQRQDDVNYKLLTGTDRQ